MNQTEAMELVFQCALKWFQASDADPAFVWPKNMRRQVIKALYQMEIRTKRMRYRLNALRQHKSTTQTDAYS